MTLPDKKIQDMKNALEKDHGREFTWDEAAQAMKVIELLAELTIDVVKEEHRRQELLKQHPKGFHLEDGSYSCLICGGPASEKNSWFDKYGLKCMTCQKAVNAKIIPGTITGNKESWYSKAELESYFNIKGADLNRYIKQTILKDRIIQGEGKGVHLQLFLLKDNKDVLPPKKLLKSRTVKVTKNGEEYYAHEPWYDFVDLKLIKRLEKYKITEYLKESFAKPVERGRFLYKGISPIFGFRN